MEDGGCVEEIHRPLIDLPPEQSSANVRPLNLQRSMKEASRNLNARASSSNPAGSQSRPVIALEKLIILIIQFIILKLFKH